MSPKETIKLKIAEKVCENLRKRNIESIYLDDRKKACEKIIKMIPEGSIIGFGGSMTILESGLIDELRKHKFDLLDRYKTGVSDAEIYEMRIKGLTSDVFVSSVNAITVDGRLVCEDGLGNRVASIIFGPKKVIIIVGVNKIVHTLEDAFARIKNIAAPMNSVRFNADTPCRTTGFCDDVNCFPPTRICGQLVIIESNPLPCRMNVVLVGEDMGF